MELWGGVGNRAGVGHRIGDEHDGGSRAGLDMGLKLGLGITMTVVLRQGLRDL